MCFLKNKKIKTMKSVVEFSKESIFVFFFSFVKFVEEKEKLQVGQVEVT